MPTTLQIPQVSYNSYFGNISKVVWFEVNDNLNYFELGFTIVPEQTRQTSLTLFNNSSNQEVWKKIYAANAQQSPVYENIQNLSTERTSQIFPYAIINNATP